MYHPAGCRYVVMVLSGKTGQTAYYMLKISNFAVFFINYLYMTLFTFYLLVILNRGETKMPAKARGVVVLSAAGIVLLIISQFSDKLFYYIDDNNFYHRSSCYLLSQLIAAAGLVLSFSILLQYKNDWKKSFLVKCFVFYPAMYIHGCCHILLWDFISDDICGGFYTDHVCS